MTSKRSNRWEWSLLRLLSLAGLFLLFPVFLILSFYYVDKSAELERVEQQVRATQFIEPALNLLRDVAYHRGLSNIYLHHTTDKRSEAQWDEITALSKKIESNVRGLEQLSALLVVEWSGKYTAIESSVGRVRDIWNELPIVQGSFSHKQVLKNFQQHSDLLQYIIILLSSLEREGDQLSALSRVILQKIPIMVEDVGQMRGLTAGYLIHAQENNMETLLSREEVFYRTQKHLALISRDFTDLRNLLERTLEDNQHLDNFIPLLFELVNSMQEEKDLIQWDILEADKLELSAEEFFQQSTHTIDTLLELGEQIKSHYRHHLDERLSEVKRKQGGVIIFLLMVTLVSLILASSVARYMLNGLKQGMKFIDGLGDGEYQQKIDTQLSGEIGEMMRSIQYAQQYLHRTEIKSVAALNRVEEQEQFMENLTNNMQNGVYALDAQGLLNFINPAAEQMLGYSAEELLGKNIHQMIHAHQPDGVFLEVEECPVHQAIIRGDKYQIERDWFICKDKTFLPVEFNTAPLLKQGLIVGSVAVFHDITPRLEMEKQLQQAVHSAELSQEVAENANRSKSDFLANMSHEIRTPMNAIIGMGHLALQTDLDPKQRGYMSKIQHAANSLLRIINDILDFSKIEAGKLDIEMTNFHLDEVVDNLDHLLAVRSREKGGIEVLFSVDPAVPNELVGDPLRLGQVLINLASNAIKFTKEGEVVVKVSLLQKSTNGEVVLQFSVKDDGIGMNQAQLSKLFTPFTQADSSTTRKYGGTGLGLTISKQLVEAMGGEIKVESQEGAGSTFSFTAQFALHAEVNLERRSLSTPLESEQDLGMEQVADIQGARILLVEDNEVNQMVAIEMLEMAGLVVEVANNGQEGVEAIDNSLQEESPFDAVLMDIQMPVMDGYEATRTIRNNPLLAELPVIAMTANAMVQDREEAASAGMVDHIAKPFDPVKLYEALKRWVIKRGHHYSSNKNITSLNEVTSSLASFTGEWIDLEQGLSMVNGKVSLYLNILRTFQSGNANFGGEIRELLKKGDQKSAQRSAHSLKGVAGTIGASVLQAQAAELEELLERDLSSKSTEILTEVLTQSEVKLAQVMDNIATILTLEEKTALSAAESTSQNSISQDALNDSFNKLLEQIEEYEMDALEHAEQLLQQADDPEFKEKIERMVGALQHYDFNKAKQIVKEYL